MKSVCLLFNLRDKVKVKLKLDDIKNRRIKKYVIKIIVVNR